MPVIVFAPHPMGKRQVGPATPLQQIAIFGPGADKMPATSPGQGRHRSPPALDGKSEWRTTMTKVFILAASAATVLVATVPAAEAGSWTSRWTGPRGGVYQGGGSCFNGACQSSGKFTGPNGGVWNQSGNARQIAPGQWAGERTITGPGGHTWQNSWTWHSGGGNL
jgi:hypothetical protein